MQSLFVVFKRPKTNDDASFSKRSETNYASSSVSTVSRSPVEFVAIPVTRPVIHKTHTECVIYIEHVVQQDDKQYIAEFVYPPF